MHFPPIALHQNYFTNTIIDHYLEEKNEWILIKLLKANKNEENCSGYITSFIRKTSIWHYTILCEVLPT